uniref:Uncharacterized protein n=1 Tax=Arundo donax TaxID=35708 RepID=A0A0A8Y3I7_ARUDO
MPKVRRILPVHFHATGTPCVTCGVAAARARFGVACTKHTQLFLVPFH